MPDVPPSDANRVPLESLVFGYVPMVPFVAGALGAWVLPSPWPDVSTGLTAIWGAMILVFVAGVRRGYGFGSPAASRTSTIFAMLAYFIPGGLALVAAAAGKTGSALILLAAGYVLVIVLDHRAALAGDAPRHFARLRPPQMAIALVSILVLLLR